MDYITIYAFWQWVLEEDEYPGRRVSFVPGYETGVYFSPDSTGSLSRLRLWANVEVE